MKTSFIHRLLLLVLLGAGYICSDASAYTTGQFLTGANNINNYSNVVVGPGNTFYGAWREVHVIKIATFNGTSWTELPSATFTGAQVAAAVGDAELDGIFDWGNQAMQVEANGNIHVVFSSGTAAGGIPNRRGLVYGKYTAGTSSWAFRKLWIMSHASGFKNLVNRSECLRLDSAGNPHVVFAWADASIFDEYLEYAFFNGTAWNVSGNTNVVDAQRLDTATIDGQNIAGSAIVFDSAGDLHCSYRKDSAGTLPDIWYVKRTGTTWGTPANIADIDNAGRTSILVDSADKVHIAEAFTSTNTVNFRVTTNVSGSFATSTVASYAVPGAATVALGDVIMKMNGAGRRIIGTTIKGNTSISNEVRFIYETSPGVWAQEAGATDVGTLTYNFPSFALRSDNTAMLLHSRALTSGSTLDRNVYFTTGIPTGFGGAPVAVAPSVSTAAQSGVTHNSATLGGNVTADGGAAVTDRGIVWGLALNPTTADNKVANGNGTGVFSATVNGLPSNTTIHVRAYATNSVSTSYGNDISFTTLPAPVAVTSLNRVNTTPSNAGTVNWTLTFASAVTGVTASNFSLTGTASAGALVGTPAITSGGGLTWNIPVTTGSTDGTLTLNLANATGLSSGISTSLPFVGESYTMDKSPPTVQSVTRLTPAGQNTNATTVTFRVTYSEPVTLAVPVTTHFQVMPVNGSTITGTVSSVSGSGDTRDVQVNITGGTGEFRLRVLD